MFPLHTFRTISHSVLIFVLLNVFLKIPEKESLLQLPIFWLYFCSCFYCVKVPSFIHSFFVQKTSFTQSFGIELLAITSLNFLSYGNVLLSPSFLKIIFSGYRFLSFQYLKNIVPLPFGSIISDEKSAVTTFFCYK